MESFLDDGNKDINRYCNPDLRLYSVLCGTIKSFDSQVLLDPFEKQFHSPSALIEYLLNKVLALLK